jgi:Tfp pilus assembly protein FimT
MLNRFTLERKGAVMSSAGMTHYLSDNGECGLSLIELVIVVTIGILVTAMAVPTLITAVNNYRLRSSVVDLNTLLQQVRMQAIRDNKSYNIASDLSGTRIFAETVNVNGSWDSGEPLVMLQRNVSVDMGNSSPAISNLGFTPSSTNLGFTSRGVPCSGVVPACSTWSGNQQVGFVFYLQSTNGGNTSWGAISVSPSGRFRSWSYSGGAWSY